MKFAKIQDTLEKSVPRHPAEHTLNSVQRPERSAAASRHAPTGSGRSLGITWAECNNNNNKYYLLERERNSINVKEVVISLSHVTALYLNHDDDHE